MADFITQEQTLKQKNIYHVLRFLWNLDLLKVVFLPSFVVIIICAALPQYFLWFTGKFVSFMADGGGSDYIAYTLFGREFKIPFLFSTLCILIGTTFTARIISWALFELTGKWSLQFIHQRMMASLSKTRTTFFDENPSGRLINRMVGNFFNLDWCIIQVGDTINTVAEILCVAVVIYIATPLPGLLIIPLIFFYFLFQFQWTPMLSHSKELRSIAFGEVMHRETDLIEGRDVFSRYNKSENLFKRLHAAYENSFNLGMFSAKIQWWGELWMAFITISFNVTTYFFLVLGIHSNSVSPVFAAIIITALLNLSDMFGYLTWSVTHLGESASNVRRIFEFIDLPDETSDEKRFEQKMEGTHAETSKMKQGIRPGAIRFKDFSMSYRKESPVILNGLNFELPYGKKIGIIGRTGSGKTSLFQSLFRMVHVRSGDILMNGDSIYSVPVDAIRKMFGVVPQDPYLFEGTIRFNMSGGNDNLCDIEMVSALTKVGLDLDLNARVKEGGKNFSQGERQLICLARTLATDKPYIIMDEPTSSVDMITDAKIQHILSEHLTGKSIITIAHRLDSLKQYDLIIEFQNGRFIRMGKPEAFPI